MKRIFSVFLSVMALWPAQQGNAQEQDNVIDEIIWVVGDEAILRSEVENERKRMLYQGEKIEGDPYTVIPEEIAIQKLFLNQAQLDSIDVPYDQVDGAVENRLNMFIAQVGSKEKLEEYMDKSISEIRQEWRTQMRNQSIVQRMRAKLTDDIQATPGEVRSFYDNLPSDSIPYVPTQVEVQIITMQPRVAQSTIDNIKARLRDYTQRVTSGESQFSTLAILYSEDPGSAANGGELGFNTRNAYVPEFATVAFQLKDPAKVSRIVETEYGFHIIQLIERRGDRANFRHILLSPKPTAKELRDTRLAMDTIRAKIDSNLVTFEQAARIVSSDKATRNSGGLMTTTSEDGSNTGRIAMDQLPPEVARQVTNMKVGEISKPFQMKDSRKNVEQVAIIKLKNRIEGHKATFTEDYQVIRDLYQQRQTEKILDDFIRQKQRETYVRIRPGWDKGDFKYPGWGKSSVK